MRSRLRAERGQTSVEYLGMIVVVAVILAGLIATTPGVGDLIGSGLRRAICLIAGSDPCPDPTGKGTRLAPVPKPKSRNDGGVWGFLKSRAGDVADAAKTTGGFVGDVGVGAYDSVKGTLTLGYELSPARAAVDPEGFLRDGRSFAKGTWFGLTHPAELGKALIDWKDLTGGHPGKAVGQWLPDIALALLTGGLGTAADGSTEAARDLSRVEKAADAARAAERIATGPDEAVFWSGIRGSDQAAATWASKNGGTTLEMAMADRGIALPPWDASKPSVVAAWRRASADFAMGAQGTVRVLQADALRVNSIWAEVEFPALKANPNVTSVLAVDPRTGTETLLWSR